MHPEISLYMTFSKVIGRQFFKNCLGLSPLGKQDIIPSLWVMGSSLLNIQFIADTMYNLRHVHVQLCSLITSFSFVTLRALATKYKQIKSDLSWFFLFPIGSYTPLYEIVLSIVVKSTISFLNRSVYVMKRYRCSSTGRPTASCSKN